MLEVYEKFLLFYYLWFMIMFKRRSTFNLSYPNKLTLNMGLLYPVLKLYTLPGDSYRINTDALIRFLPLIAPLMHDVDVCFHYFFVPYRLIWDNGKDDCWETFYTRAIRGTTPPVAPFMDLKVTGESELSDYIGVPPCNWGALEEGGGLKVSALPYRAYRAIYNSWYLPPYGSQIPPQDIQLSGGNDTKTGITLLRRLWYKDYFTSVMPDIQMDGESRVPVEGVTQTISGKYDSTEIGLTAHLGDDSKLQTYGNGKSTVFSNYNQDDKYPSDTQGPQGRYLMDVDSTGFVNLFKPNGGTPTFNDQFWSSPTGEVYPTNLPDSYMTASGDWTFGLDKTYPHGIVKGDMDITGTLPSGSVNLTTNAQTVGYFSIRNLRIYSALQRWRERALQLGSTYRDQLKTFFGIKPRDARLQLPEYIGGFKSPCLFSEVLQTSSTNTTTPQGNMAGHGFSAKIGKPIKYFCPEHGIIMGLLSVMPRATYSQGLSKDLTRFSPSDYFNPMYQSLGSQAVYNKEIYATAPSYEREGIFGYQDRYAEYKSIPGEVHGAFRSSLDYWHLGRKFDQMPVYGESFLQCNPGTNIFANTNTKVDHIAAHVQHNIIAKRPMAKYVTGRLY